MELLMRVRIASFISLILFTCSGAFAVIAAKIPVGKIVETSKSVLLARVTQLNPSNRVMDVELTEALKGEGPQKMRVQVVEPKAIFAGIKVGDPIIIMTGKGREANRATIHLSGAWFIADGKPESTPPAWQIIQPQSNDFRKAFPGSTPALAKIFREIK